MKPLLELNLDDPKERKALDLVLKKIATGKVIATIKQIVVNGDSYTSNVIQTAVAETNTLVDINQNLIYITVRNLNKGSVKRLQNLWKTVLKRGTVRYKEGNENDYVMTVDCAYTDEHQGKSYLLGCFMTPIFCSGDGDEDLMFVVPAEDCFISIDRYSRQATDYEMTKQIERGDTITPILNEDYESDEGDY